MLLTTCGYYAYLKKRSEILTKNTLGVKKVVAKNLKKAWMKKKWNQKWAAKACVVLQLIKIKF